MLPVELSDEKIMLRVKEGHLSELTELFDRYHLKLFNFFWKLTFDKPASEDLTQTLFYRVMKYRLTFNVEQGSFKSWVYRMARNIHVDFCNEQAKRPDRYKHAEEHLERLADGGERYNEDHLVQLDAALLKLDPEQRELIVMSRYQGLKYDEISQIKDISVPAIKVRIHRAIKELRQYYFT
ncbi:RNA polymerase sigma factor [Dinghuibacter silviterrae]|uniref:RNA polymerase sigma-70 factor (ECF subfamily) n=1 Tax=Dinghuibacter silviterrae TaxID=1539049 RepID=A0A4R8DFN5_9BACT|nr:RNA polymerase sigma factor [Dinghuibacter silviterrae]TDW96409.1 RNA polymerase sigma-70 factor (ECF subfamily) [Dinghuibacter silviterrae]